ncbi:translocation/assembly module TamB domain-containing protein [Azotobacter bryophylli]|uniref:Translocation/assembly module TamB domain-containing protein n=1 Tax=Azotobacter bryophylli TaxID=1986537 RepID=A0ABV7ATP9_9GAMM
MTYLRRTLAVLFALLLALFLAVAGLLGTEAGSRWLLGRIAGLQVEGFAGRLGGSWQAERLLWEQGERRAELSAVQFAWRPSCLLGMTLCVDRLASGQIVLQFPPGGQPATTGPLRLPQLKLPLRLRLGEVQVGRLLLNGTEQLQSLQAAANWTGEGIAIESLELRRQGLALSLTGSLQPAADWPLAARGELALAAPGGQPWRIALQVDGALQGTLNLQADSSGFFPGRLEGSVEPLAERLPARFRLTADGFKPIAGLPDTLRLDRLELVAAGDLQDGYEVQGTASLPAEGGAMPLALLGRLTKQDAELSRLELDAGNGQRVALDAKLDWREGLAAEARLDWQDFPWLRLYPGLAEPPVALRRLGAELSYRDGNYLGNFAADLHGPAGPFSLSSPLSGDLRQVHLPQLQLVAGQGKAEGQLSLNFAEGLAWNASLQLSDLNPAYWRSELVGNLDGPLRSRGEFRAGRLELEATVELAGRLRGQPARLQTEAKGAGQVWDLSRLDLRLGDNRIQGSGRLDRGLKGQLVLAMPRLGQLWPGLRGRIDGALDLAGSLQAPEGGLALEARQLAMGERSLDGLTLAATLDGAQRGRLELNGSGIRLGATQLGNLKAVGQGDRREQRLDLGLSGPDLQLALGLDGRLEQGASGWSWRGRLGSGSVQSGGQDWRLQQPASLERLADGSLNLGAHCWRSAAASLCAEDRQRLLPEPHLNIRLRDFPLDNLAAFWPQDFAWQGRLNGDLQLELPKAGPRGRIFLDAGNGVLRIRDQGQWRDFPYRQLHLESLLQPERVDSRLAFAGERLGELNLRAQIDPRPQDPPLSGEFSLRGFDLAVIRPFAGPVEELQGQVNGNGTLRGSLRKPQINGRIELRDGLIAGTRLPMRFEALQLQALIAGESLQLDGDWRSGEKGRGELDGTLDWRQAPDLNLGIRGNRLPVSVEPYAALEVDPDLRLRLVGKQLALSGKLQVPRGRIRIRELPPSSVKVSEDAVVAGREPEAAQPLTMLMDVNVEVGRDKLSFEGFGLNAELAGQLHVGNNMDTRGELDLKNGRYRAYGQRLDIRRARLLFVGAIDQPYLDVEAIRKVEDVTAGLRVGGSALQPQVEIFSEPAMSQEQALSYLILGRAPGANNADSNTLAQAALSLGLAGSSPLTGSLAERLGIKEFELGTKGSGTQTSVVASGKISERLSLVYGMGVFDSLSSVALRYQLSRRLYIEAASGVASSLDVFYKRDF